MTSVLVKNVAPSNLQINPPAAIDENGVATLELTFDDPGTQDTHLVEVDWGDGTAVELFNVTAGERFFATTHQYCDDNPDGDAGRRLRDQGAGAGRRQRRDFRRDERRPVNNVAPSNVVIDPLATINENDFATLELTFDDPGTLDTHEVEIDWGDGSAVEIAVPSRPARGSFSTTHQYLDDDPTVTSSDIYTVERPRARRRQRGVVARGDGQRSP